MEKDTHYVADSPENGHAPAAYVDPATGIESKTGRISEAADIYGDIETAEEFGYVTRG
jgi:amino acid transporter